MLPRYEHVVLDEAHHLEDVATEFAGRSVSGRGILQQLGRVCPTRGRRKGLGLRIRLAAESAGGDDASVNLMRAVDKMRDELEALRITLKLHLGDLADAILESGGLAQDGRRELHLRLDDKLAKDNVVLLGLIEDKLSELRALLAQLGTRIQATLDAIQDMAPQFGRRHGQLGLDLKTVQNRLLDAAASLGLVLDPNPDSVRWVDLARDKQGQYHPRFHVRPIEVAHVLDETLFAGVRSATLTSATLSVAGGFEHYQKRTGVGLRDGSSERYASRKIESPFDYASQVWLGIPNDLPDPGTPGYGEALADVITDSCRAAGGRTFALFTSYRALDEAASRTAQLLGPDYTVLRQGQLPRRLLQLFREGRKTVLFGTDSFWEGVDVRGEALSCVIISRLPFRVPSEPIQLARAERIEATGGDPFRDMSLPQAILRFRQGFGRLIRHQADRGVVLVLDGRIKSRRYGERFLASLPKGLHPHYESRASISSGIRRFFESNRE